MVLKATAKVKEDQVLFTLAKKSVTVAAKNFWPDCCFKTIKEDWEKQPSPKLKAAKIAGKCLLKYSRIISHVFLGFF